MFPQKLRLKFDIACTFQNSNIFCIDNITTRHKYRKVQKEKFPPKKIKSPPKKPKKEICNFPENVIHERRQKCVKIFAEIKLRHSNGTRFKKVG